MYQMYTAKHLRKNDDLITILENLLGTSYTPKRMMQTDGTVALLGSLECFTYKAKHVIDKEDLKTRLENWAKENEMVVIATSCAVIVFCASLTLPKPPITMVSNPINGEITMILNRMEEAFSPNLEAGLYSANEDAIKENIPIIEAEYDSNEATSRIITEAYEESPVKDTVTEMLDEYMQAKVKDADVLSEDTNVSREASIELFSTKDSASSTENIVETPNTVSESCGVEIVIPSSVRQTGLCRNYTSYTYYYGRWNRGTGQKALSEQWGAAGKPSSNGIATLNGRYLVAVSPKFGSVGDHIDIVLSDGQIIPATIADAKGRDATSEWGHVLTKSGAVDIIEWEATGAKSDIDLGSWKNVTVDKIINYGKEIVPVYEEEASAEIITYSANPSLEETTNDIPTKITEEVTPDVFANTEYKPTQTLQAEQNEQTYIKRYCDIYGLDFEKVYQILSNITNNFQDEAYQSENIIGTSEVNGKTIICTSKEMAILLAVRNIYQNPEAFGYQESDLKTGIPHQTDLTFADQIFHASNVLGVDPALNYAICQATSSFSSPMFLMKNNPSNLKWNDAFATFPSPMAGFIEEGIELLSYKTEGLTGIASLQERNKRDIKPENPMWVSNVTFIYNYVMEHYDTIFTPQSDKTLSDAKIYVLY